jgi:hypothetical protein
MAQKPKFVTQEHLDNLDTALSGLEKKSPEYKLLKMEKTNKERTRKSQLSHPTLGPQLRAIDDEYNKSNSVSGNSAAPESAPAEQPTRYNFRPSLPADDSKYDIETRSDSNSLDPTLHHHGEMSLISDYLHNLAYEKESEHGTDATSSIFKHLNDAEMHLNHHAEVVTGTNAPGATSREERGVLAAKHLNSASLSLGKALASLKKLGGNQTIRQYAHAIISGKTSKRQAESFRAEPVTDKQGNPIAKQGSTNTSILEKEIPKIAADFSWNHGSKTVEQASNKDIGWGDLKAGTSQSELPREKSLVLDQGVTMSGDRPYQGSREQELSPERQARFEPLATWPSVPIGQIGKNRFVALYTKGHKYNVEHRTYSGSVAKVESATAEPRSYDPENFPFTPQQFAEEQKKSGYLGYTINRQYKREYGRGLAKQVAKTGYKELSKLRQQQLQENRGMSVPFGSFSVSDASAETAAAAKKSRFDAIANKSLFPAPGKVKKGMRETALATIKQAHSLIAQADDQIEGGTRKPYEDIQELLPRHMLEALGPHGLEHVRETYVPAAEQKNTNYSSEDEYAPIREEESRGSESLADSVKALLDANPGKRTLTATDLRGLQEQYAAERRRNIEVDANAPAKKRGGRGGSNAAFRGE